MKLITSLPVHWRLEEKYFVIVFFLKSVFERIITLFISIIKINVYTLIQIVILTEHGIQRKTMVSLYISFYFAYQKTMLTSDKYLSNDFRYIQPT